MAQHLHPTSSCRKGSALTSDPILSKRHNTHIWPCVNTSHQNGLALIFDHVQTHSIRRDLHLHLTMFKNTASEGLCTYIRPCSKTLHWKGFALTFDHVWTHRIERALRPRLRILGNWLGASILPENGINPYIWSSGNTSLNHIRMAMHSHMIM